MSDLTKRLRTLDYAVTKIAAEAIDELSAKNARLTNALSRARRHLKRYSQPEALAVIEEALDETRTG